MTGRRYPLVEGAIELAHAHRARQRPALPAQSCRRRRPSKTQCGLAELAAGIALTFSELVTALVGWLVAKLRGTISSMK